MAVQQSVSQQQQQGAPPAAMSSMEEMVEEVERILGPPAPPLSQSWLTRLCYSIPVNQSLTAEHMEILRRQRLPGHFKRLAMEREVVKDCLHHYNHKHPGNEYEPAPGKVNLRRHFHKGACFRHGNFVARKKRSGWFSCLPAPRTLFFFELVHSHDFDGVATCTPLEEPVTESYSVLGFPLWWSTRRSGKLDSYCKTCCRRFDVPHPGIQKIFACGHKSVQKVCEMCYRRSNVLHPPPGEFAFGYHHPYQPGVFVPPCC